MQIAGPQRKFRRWENWLGWLDSNQRSRDQNPLPCRLATPHTGKQLLKKLRNPDDHYTHKHPIDPDTIQSANQDSYRSFKAIDFFLSKPVSLTMEFILTQIMRLFYTLKKIISVAERPSATRSSRRKRRLPPKQISIFICYAWKRQPLRTAHADWVQRLVSKFRGAGFKVVIDLDCNMHSGDIREFAERGIKKATYIVVVGTPEMGTKATRNRTIVGRELSMIFAKFARNPACVYPVLKEGTNETAFPYSLVGQSKSDLSTDALFESELPKIIQKMRREASPRLGRSRQRRIDETLQAQIQPTPQPQVDSEHEAQLNTLLEETVQELKITKSVSYAHRLKVAKDPNFAALFIRYTKKDLDGLLDAILASRDTNVQTKIYIHNDTPHTISLVNFQTRKGIQAYYITAPERYAKTIPPGCWAGLTHSRRCVTNNDSSGYLGFEVPYISESTMMKAVVITAFHTSDWPNVESKVGLELRLPNTTGTVARSNISDFKAFVQDYVLKGSDYKYDRNTSCRRYKETKVENSLLGLIATAKISGEDERRRHWAEFVVRISMPG